jgi:hypothetical protein
VSQSLEARKIMPMTAGATRSTSVAKFMYMTITSMYTKVTGAFGKPYSAIVLQRRCVRASIPGSGLAAAFSVNI